MTQHNDATNQRPKVLVVDDSQTIRMSAQSIIGHEYEIELAEDGFAALAKLATFTPDLIFIDIVMPRLDGYDAVTLLRTNKKFAATPVIMMSSRGGAFDVAKGRLVGCTDYVVKPFDGEAMKRVLNKYLHQAEASQPES